MYFTIFAAPETSVVEGVPGDLSEWLKEHAWKVCIPQKGIEGSNPSVSAFLFSLFILPSDYLHYRHIINLTFQPGYYI